MSVVLWIVGSILYVVIAAVAGTVFIRVCNNHGDSMVDEPLMNTMLGLFWPVMLVMVPLGLLMFSLGHWSQRMLTNHGLPSKFKS